MTTLPLDQLGVPVEAVPFRVEADEAATYAAATNDPNPGVPPIFMMRSTAPISTRCCRRRCRRAGSPVWCTATRT